MVAVSDYDLIALDLDGTLLDSHEQISPRNRSAVSKALLAGVRVVLVTGRGAETPVRISHELGLNVPVICAHGALTKDFLSGKVLGHIPVPLRYAVPMLEYAERHDLSAAVYTDETFYRIAGSRIFMADMTGPHWAEVAHFADVLASAPTFIRFLGGDSVRAIRAEFGELPLAFKHESWGTFEELAVTSLDATKDRALAQLCATYGIPAKRVLAIGDSRNDVAMLQWSGMGIAMANALPEVLAAIPTHTGTNDEDGVADAIERYVLSSDARKSA